jgi:hypothetical protein
MRLFRRDLIPSYRRTRPPPFLNALAPWQIGMDRVSHPLIAVDLLNQPVVLGVGHGKGDHTPCLSAKSRVITGRSIFIISRRR